MKLMYITNDLNVAREAQNAGVDRIFLDLEVNGKHDRQKCYNTYISDHKLEDIPSIRKVLNNSELLVRINPIYEGTKKEIEYCIYNNVDVIMLPMFKTKEEVEYFIKLVNKQAKVCLLLETSQALSRIDDILEVEGIDEIHIGLNDLHIALSLDFMFELLTGGLIEYLSRKILSKNILFGFGGIARIGEGDIPSEILIGEHYRLGSNMVILSRTFRNKRGNVEVNIMDEVKKVRDVEYNIKSFWKNSDFIENLLTLKYKVRDVSNNKRRLKCTDNFLKDL